jgi:hypothetical protein
VWFAYFVVSLAGKVSQNDAHDSHKRYSWVPSGFSLAAFCLHPAFILPSSCLHPAFILPSSCLRSALKPTGKRGKNREFENQKNKSGRQTKPMHQRKAFAQNPAEADIIGRERALRTQKKANEF